MISTEELINLAESGYAPHYRIKDGPPMFKLSEIKEWVKNNLLNAHGGRVLPKVVRVFNGNEPQREAVPSSIRRVQGLRDISSLLFIGPGIYFLCKEQEVVYVGQSVNATARVHQHAKKEFDSVFFLPWPEDDLSRIEAAFIRFLQPPLNGRQKNGLPIMPQSVSEKEAGRILESLIQEVSVP